MAFVRLVCTFTDELEVRFALFSQYTVYYVLEDIGEVVTVSVGHSLILTRLVLAKELADELDVPARVNSRANAIFVKASIPVAEDFEH